MSVCISMLTINKFVHSSFNHLFICYLFMDLFYRLLALLTPLIHSLTQHLIHFLSHALPDPLTHSSTRSLIHSVTHSMTDSHHSSLIHSLTQLSTHSLTHSHSINHAHTPFLVSVSLFLTMCCMLQVISTCYSGLLYSIILL